MTRWVLAVFACASVALPSARALDTSAAASSSTPVVFLMLDEFPTISLMNAKGEIDAARYPNFARLARGATWYRNMTTVSPTTTYAVPAALSGIEPKRGARPVFSNYPNNLFTLLGGYRLNVIETQTRLCPRQLCPYKGATLPRVNMHTFFVGRVHTFEKFVGRLKAPASGAPSLNYLHLLLPHGPWIYFPTGRVRAAVSPAAPGRSGDRWWDDGLALQAWQRHLLQVGYTDRLLGRLLDRLTATGLWDKALIVVTADEGDNFRGGDYRRKPTSTNLANVAFIPLFIRTPGQRKPRIDDRHVSTIDILPTIADTLGVHVSWHMDGRSLLAEGEGSDVVQLGSVKASFADALKQRTRSLARELGLFGSGTWGPAFAGTGSYRALVGKPLGALRITGSTSARAQIDSVGSALLRSLPKDSPQVPSPIFAKLDGILRHQDVALALNGRIAAVAQAYPGGPGRMRLSELPLESAFKPGANSVRMFLVSGRPATPTLRELRVALS